jgi:hypothetical protein
MFTLVFGAACGAGATWFVIRFKEPLQFWKKRVEANIEKNLKGE